MQPTLCSRCKKNVAVVFISKLDGDKTTNEGLCLKCAKDLGLPQVDEMMKRMGISDEDLEGLSSEMMQMLGTPEELDELLEKMTPEQLAQLKERIQILESEEDAKDEGVKEECVKEEAGGCCADEEKAPELTNEECQEVNE